MTDEEIIRHEANEFSKPKFRRLQFFNADSRMKEIRQELLKFYSYDHKGIFLDEVQKELLVGLQEHRDKSHAGQPKKDCMVEIVAKILFFCNYSAAFL